MLSVKTLSETFEEECWISVVCCLLLACVYDGSLYVWRGNLPRWDHPNTIKRRFTSVLCVSAASPLVVLLLFIYINLFKFNVHHCGHCWAFIFFPAALLPLTLTMVCYCCLLFYFRSWIKCVKDLRWLRNQVMALLTEESVFRACMIPMLVPCTGFRATIFISPLLFGVAHFHHIIEQLRFGQDTVFEILICMGFPAIGLVLQHPQRPVLLLSYQLGVLLFLILLFPFTDPAFYGMTPICTLRFHQKYLNLCSKDVQRSYRFRMT
uniref:CAAX prenyl protease 2 n=1 Tax=Cyprinus carpio TaxID=7962 RepID=A0A8C1IFY5_CYPCA